MSIQTNSIDTAKWYEFMRLAQTTLLQGQKLDEFKPTIQVAFEPSFDDHVHLQIVIYDHHFKWYRTTWQKNLDSKRFFDPIEALKYVGKPLVPSFKYENGTTKIDEIKAIVTFAKNISVKPQLDSLGGLVLDGCFYTLTIGIESAQSNFKWHYLPKEWSELQQLADMMEKLNQGL